jgi:putative endonuclease
MFVYLLESVETGWRYIGQTQDLADRLKRHNSGKERSTRRFSPFKVAGYILVPNRKAALTLERKLKNMKSRDLQYRYFVNYGVVE